LHTQVSVGEGPPTPLELVWDPLVEALEAVPCPTCSRPTFELGRHWQRGLSCPACVAAAPMGKRVRQR